MAGVAACLASGRRALVLVPEAEPVPATARAVLDAFGDRAAGFLGGDRRERYRIWLEHRGPGGSRWWWPRARRVRAAAGPRAGLDQPGGPSGPPRGPRALLPRPRRGRGAGPRSTARRACCRVMSIVRGDRARASRPVAAATAPVAPPVGPLVETPRSEAEDRDPAGPRSGSRIGGLIFSRCRVRGGAGLSDLRRARRPARPAGDRIGSRPAAVVPVCGAPGRCAHCGAATSASSAAGPNASRSGPPTDRSVPVVARDRAASARPRPGRDARRDRRGP